MIRPIVAYGMPVLRQKGKEVDWKDPEIKKLVEDLFETMDGASGVGLAAPQVNEAVRVFVIDPAPLAEHKNLSEEEKKLLRNSRMAFINARKIEESGEPVVFEEGCLSIPGVYEKVKRPGRITLEYYDLEGNKQVRTFDGLLARVIQHEYDHIEGILFTDLLSPLKRRMIKKKLEKIKRGDVQVAYKMKFPRQR